MDNRASYGFRFVKSYTGARIPDPIEMIIATGTNFNVTAGLQNARLRAGDVVAKVNTGGVILCAGNETTPVEPFGVVVGLKPYFDGTQMQFSDSIPSGISYGTNLDRQTKVLIQPFAPGLLFEVDVDDIVTATTEAGYQAFWGENVSFINTAAALATPAYVTPKLDISTHNVSAALFFRIVRTSATLENIDFSGANVKLLVEANLATLPAYDPLGI